MDLTKVTKVKVEGVDMKDYPEFSDAFIVSANYNGVEMTEAELDELNENQEFVLDSAYVSLI